MGRTLKEYDLRELQQDAQVSYTNNLNGRFVYTC